MKTKFLQRVLWLMIPLLTIFTTNVWAVTVKDTITLAGFGGITAASYRDTETSGTTNKGVGAKMNHWNGSSGQIKVNQGNTSTLNASNYYVFNTEEIPGSITKVELIITSGSTTVNYFQIAGSSSAAITTNQSWNTSNAGSHIGSTQNLQWTFDEEDEIVYFRIGCAKNGGTVKASYVVITYEGDDPGGGCTTGDATEIKAGDVVLIYYPSASKEFGGFTENNGSYYGDIHGYTTTPDGYFPFTVEAGSASGYWSFKNGSTYLAMSASANNRLVGSDTKNDASSWSVSINGSTKEATITNKSFPSYLIKYNTGTPRFSNYTSGAGSTALPKIYMYCDPVTYRVTYYGNGNTGGTVPTDNNEYTSAQSATVLGNTGTLVKTGYTWAGWNTQADGNGTTYTAGNSISMSGGSVSLYAKWVPVYTVTWVVNGSEARTDNNVGSGTALTPPTISPLPCGDKLAGWTDAEGGNYTHGTSTLYTGATITITATKTFYAVFADYAN